MAKHIGIVACSAEGAALCYRTICAESVPLLGEHAHPEITMHTHPLAEYMVGIRSGDWARVAELMASSCRKVAAVGAQFAICPDNTIHQAFDRAVQLSPIPWLHIARVVAEEARRRGYATLGVLGTRYLMEGPVYPDALRPQGLACLIPDADDRERINAIIFKELVNAIFKEESRLYFNAVMEGLKARGVDAVVLGCTEIPLVVRPDDTPLPTLDSTRLLARAAIRHAIQPP
jgi:aspartate racemase